MDSTATVFSSRFLSRNTLISLALLLLSGPVRGTPTLLDVPLEQLLQLEVVGASRFVQASREAPSAVTVLTREQIRDHAWHTLADALDSVPGLFITSDRVYSYLGVRGFQQPSDYNSNVLLLIDGVPANDGVYNQAFLGTAGLLDMAIVERIEFIPGPGSSVYGSNAILGVINVVTSTGRALRGTTIEGSTANHGGRGAAVRYGATDDQRDTLLSASTWHSDGESFTLADTPDTSFGRARGLEAERGHRLAVRHAWDEFVLLAAHSERSKGYATAPYGTTFGDRRTRARDAQWLVSLGHESEWLPGLSVLSRASVGGAEYRGSWAYPLPDGLNRDDSDSRWWGAELQATDLRFDRHTLVYGFEFRNHYRLFQQNADIAPDPDFVRFRDQRSSRQFGAYIQDEWRLANWRVNAGVRLDQYSSFGNTVNPRVGLIHELTPQTTIKYLAGTAYRAPNAYEMYYHDGNDLMKANPDLQPERVRSLEWVVEHRTATNWQLRSSVFHNRIRNLIAQELDTDGLLVYRNHGKADVHGLELALRRDWADGTRLSMSWSWHEARDGERRERMTHSPRHLAKADLTLPFGNWRTTLETRYIGNRATTAGHLGSQTWGNLVLTHAAPLAGGARIALRVVNIFDRDLADPASEEFEHDHIPRTGRTVRMTASWQF